MAYQGNQINYNNLNDELKVKIDKAEGVESQVQALTPKVDNSWQKDVYNNARITNLGTKKAIRTFTVNQSDWKNTGNVEQLGIVIPFRGAFSGSIKVNYSVMWGESGSWGSTEVIYNIASFVPETKLNDFTILTASSTMMKDFRIVQPWINSANGDMAILLFRAPTANNPLEITVDLDGTYSSTTHGSNLFYALKNAYVTTEDLGSPTAQGYPWTPQASQIPTYEAIGRWDSVADRFSPYCKLIGNWDDAVTNGLYMASNEGLNSPNGNWCTGEVTAHNEIWITQIVHEFSSTGHYYMRRKIGSPEWTGWTRVPDKQMYDQLFQSVSDGKTKVASAISDKGVYTSPVETFDNMANNIGLIPSGVKKADLNISYPDIPPHQTVTVTSQAINFLPMNTTTPMMGSCILNGRVMNIGDNATYIGVPYISEITPNGLGNGQFSLSFKIKNPMVIVGTYGSFPVVVTG